MRFRAAFERPGQRHRFGIAEQRRCFNRWSAGKAKPKELRRLVKRFARRIVNRGGKPPISPDALHQQQAGNARQKPAAANREIASSASARRGLKRMPLQMIDRDQWLARRMGQRFCSHQPDHHAADQPRPRSRRNGINIRQRYASIRQRRLRSSGISASTCARAAISGTTPPKGRCAASCPASDAPESAGRRSPKRPPFRRNWI